MGYNAHPDDEPKNAFGLRLMRLISKRGWTQQRMADEMGVDPVLVNQWVCSRRHPSYPMLRRIYKALGLNPVEMAELMGLWRRPR